MAYAAARPDTLAAASDLRSYQFYWVMMDGSGTIALATGADTTAPLAILLNEPNTGEGCELSKPGELHPCKVGTDGVSAGNPVRIDTTIDGTIEDLDTGTDTDVMVGWATEDGVAGEIITMLTCTPIHCTDASKLGAGL